MRTSGPVLTWLLLFAGGCASTAVLDPDKQADVVEAKLAEIGEQRVIAGAATQPVQCMFELNKLGLDGNWAWGLQEVAMVHVVAGNLSTGMSVYRVGLVGGQAAIVCKTGLRSNIYEVVWESWPDGRKRAGSPAPTRLCFED